MKSYHGYYVVINTTISGTHSLGTVVSCHRSPKAAWSAREKFSRRVERANGKGLSTGVARVGTRRFPGGHVRPDGAKWLKYNPY
jgi:hypothetical protein